MEKFNAEEAEKGRPICTRAGQDVEFLYNRDGLTMVRTRSGRRKYIQVHSDTGKINSNRECEYDLFMKSVVK